MTPKFSPRRKLAAARLMAAHRAPYYTSALLALQPVEAPGLGTLAVTHDLHLMYDPAAVDGWTVAQVAGVLVHEVNHVLREYWKRLHALGAIPDLFNVASDMEINDDLRGTWDLPHGMVVPEQIPAAPGGLAEAYYALLLKRSQSKRAAAGAKAAGAKQDGPQGRGQPGDGPAPKQPGGGAGKGPPGDDAGGNGGGDGDDLVPSRPMTGRGWCGSVGGRAVPGEPEGGGRSDADVQRIRRQVAEEVRQAAQKNRGEVPGGLTRWADQALAPPRIRWQEKLARVTRVAMAYRPGAIDLSYRHPSRRQAGIGYGPGRAVLPALRAPVPRVAVVTDTSGSMGSDELGAALRETRGVLLAVGADVTFLACDAAVHELRQVASIRDAVKLLKGGGGTSFKPPFEALAKQRRRPEVIIFATDGMGDAPVAPPAWARVIWLLIGPHRQKPCAGTWGGPPIAWGEFVEIESAA